LPAICSNQELRSDVATKAAGSKFLLYVLMVLELLLGEDGFVVGWCGEQVEDDTGQFVGCGGDGLGRAESGAHPSVVLAEPELAAVECLRGHAQCLCGAVVPPAGVSAEDLAATYPVVRCAGFRAG
jgi:hypothetical protein